MDPLKLLYVDDEPDIREVAVMSLEMDEGLDVRAVSSGPAALALLDGGEFTPQVIMLDVMMPDMDGPATFAAIRERPGMADVPVIFITARAQDRDRERLMALGAAGVITKPFDPMSLARQVRALVGA